MLYIDTVLLDQLQELLNLIWLCFSSDFLQIYELWNAFSGINVMAASRADMCKSKRLNKLHQIVETDILLIA